MIHLNRRLSPVAAFPCISNVLQFGNNIALVALAKAATDTQLPLGPSSGFLVTVHRTRFSSRRRQFFDIPQRANVNSDNDIITTSVIAWSFYPKLLIRDGKGFRNVANNQSISLHPTSVNKGRHDLKWLSYYHIMQAKQ